MKLEVLVTTMHQPDLNKYNEMNLKTDVIISNQADCNGFTEEEVDGNTVTMITTATRGLSRNRNIALCHSTADIVIFSDDDLTFKNDYEQIVLGEFEKHPEADAIKFNLDCISERKISMKPIENFHKPSRIEVTSWGVCGLAVKRIALIKSGLFFNESFGTGTENFCGEDSIFYQELFKRKINLYASPIYIADIDQTSSSWFEGFTDKYFRVSGKILVACYPRLANLLAIRSAYRFHKRQPTLSFRHILDCYRQGIKEYLK